MAARRSCAPRRCRLPAGPPLPWRAGVGRARHGGRAGGVRAGPGADRLRSLPPPSAAEMRGAKKRQALPAIVLLLLASAPPPPGAEGRDVPAAGTERGKLLDLLLQALDDDGRPLPPRPPRRDRLISRRYSGGAPPPDPRPIAAAAPRTPPAAAAAPPPPRLFTAARAGGKNPSRSVPPPPRSCWTGAGPAPRGEWGSVRSPDLTGAAPWGSPGRGTEASLGLHRLQLSLTPGLL